LLSNESQRFIVERKGDDVPDLVGSRE